MVRLFAMIWTTVQAPRQRGQGLKRQVFFVVVVVGLMLMPVVVKGGTSCRCTVTMMMVVMVMPVILPISELPEGVVSPSPDRTMRRQDHRVFGSKHHLCNRFAGRKPQQFFVISFFCLCQRTDFSLRRLATSRSSSRSPNT